MTIAITGYNRDAAVDAGVKWLDETIPDWRSQIDWERLDLSSMSACIGGQLSGVDDYCVFIDHHGLSAWEARFGLWGAYDPSKGETALDLYDYAALTESWKRYRPIP